MSGVRELEHQQREAKLVIEKAERLERLLNNADFREVIINGFSRDDAAHYVQESMDPALTSEQRSDALALAQAPGHLKRWIQAQLNMANYHRNNEKELSETLEEVRLSEEAMN